MHTKVLRGLRIRDTPILDQPNSLKLELPCKLPSLHDSPPVPSKHLTRCPRNRVQAKPVDRTPRKAVDYVLKSIEWRIPDSNKMLVLPKAVSELPSITRNHR